MSTSTDSIERIYIGGFDPPRLTAQDVLSRLPTSGVTIHSVESHADKPYCHLTATATGDESKTALQILFSTLNNVKWKGCRLSVQSARPHFLERLEQERRDRQDALKQQSSQDAEIIETQIKESKIPRRLRVRKKYGDEAYHVDTKPWVVENWSNFTHAVGKQRKRKEKHQLDTKDVPTPLLHRAIHIRFDHQGGSNTGKERSVEQGDEEDDDGSHGSMESSDGNTSDSEIENEVNTKKEGYEWSDDDEDEDLEEVVAEASMESNTQTSDASEMDDIPNTKLNGIGHDDDNSSSSNMISSSRTRNQNVNDEKVDEPIQAPSFGCQIPTSTTPEMPSRNYHWSSDDDSNDDEDETLLKDRNRPLLPVTQVDEFAAGLDPEDDDGDDGEINGLGDDTDNYTKQEKVPGDADLTNDVSANLNILSSLFPEVANTLPANTKPSIHDSETGTTITSTSGFAASGIMLRYDPNDASNKQYEIQDNALQQESTNSAQLSGGVNSHDTNDDSMQVDQLENYVPDKTVKVYEQKKLEEVFREAREAWQGVGTSESAPCVLTGSSSGAAFAFGFELGSSDSKQLQPTSGFSFGFDFSNPTEKVTTSSPAMQPAKCDADEKGDVDNLGISSPLKQEKRRKGFLFPDDALEKYKTTFFSLNNGIEIMRDVESFRKDPEVKEAWNKERHTLTLDWKRKQKHAQSRIQKRMKIR